MTEENLPLMSLGQLSEAMHRGTRLCSECMPMRAPATNGAIYWNVCIARLPLQNSGAMTHRLPEEITNQMLRKGPEHYRVLIPEDEESNNYLMGVFKTPHDPGVWHTTREMIFVRLDIAKFTQFPEHLQPRVIAELHEIAHRVLSEPIDGLTRKPERVLHTGDGFILAFASPSGDREPWPLELAQGLAKALDQRNDTSWPIRFRIAVTMGPVYITGDLTGNQNYIGHSISESERLLQCIPSNQDDVVCFSEAVYRKYREGLAYLKFFRMGSVSDKHQTMHRLYLLEYTD